MKKMSRRVYQMTSVFISIQCNQKQLMEKEIEQMLRPKTKPIAVVLKVAPLIWSTMSTCKSQNLVVICVLELKELK